MIGGDEINCSVSEGLPQFLAILPLTDWRRAFEFRGTVGNFIGCEG